VRAQDLTREHWDTFLRWGGADLFRKAIEEQEQGEQMLITLTVQAEDGSPVPEPVALMIVMRAAIKTLAMGIAVDEWMSENTGS
jgi:hypothetical protein